MDNGLAFISHRFATFYKKYNIKNSFSSYLYPQGNGLVESTNQQLIKILMKNINDKLQ